MTMQHQEHGIDGIFRLFACQVEELPSGMTRAVPEKGRLPNNCHESIL